MRRADGLGRGVRRPGWRRAEQPRGGAFHPASLCRTPPTLPRAARAPVCLGVPARPTPPCAPHTYIPVRALCAHPHATRAARAPWGAGRFPTGSAPSFSFGCCCFCLSSRRWATRFPLIEKLLRTWPGRNGVSFLRPWLFSTAGARAGNSRGGRTRDPRAAPHGFRVGPGWVPQWVNGNDDELHINPPTPCQIGKLGSAVGSEVPNRTSNGFRTAPDTENFRRLNETFYIGSCGFRSVSLI